MKSITAPPNYLITNIQDYELFLEKGEIQGVDNLAFDAVLVGQEDDHRVFTHRILLSSCPLLSTILANSLQDEEMVTIRLPDWSVDQLKRLRIFLTVGQVFGSEEELSEFADLLRCLKLEANLEQFQLPAEEVQGGSSVLRGKNIKILEVVEQIEETKAPDEDETMFSCEICEKKFKLQFKLNNHYKRCSSSPFGRYIKGGRMDCPLCDDKNIKPSHFILDHVDVYTRLKDQIEPRLPLVCDRCPQNQNISRCKIFRLARNYINHRYIQCPNHMKSMDEFLSAELAMNSKSRAAASSDSISHASSRTPSRASASENSLFQCEKCHVRFLFNTDSEEKSKAGKDHVCDKDTSLKLHINENPTFTHKSTLECVLCDVSRPCFYNYTDLKLHYIFGHFNGFFKKFTPEWNAFFNEESSRTWKCPYCAKNQKEFAANSWEDAIRHLGVVHEKLYQAMKHHKKTDMTNVLKRLYPDKHKRHSKFTEDGQGAKLFPPRQPATVAAAAGTPTEQSNQPTAKRGRFNQQDNTSNSPANEHAASDIRQADDRAPQELLGREADDSPPQPPVNMPRPSRRRSRNASNTSDSSIAELGNEEGRGYRIRPIDGYLSCLICPSNKTLCSSEEHMYNHMVDTHFRKTIEHNNPMDWPKQQPDSSYIWPCGVDNCDGTFPNAVARLKHIGTYHGQVVQCLADRNLVANAKRAAGNDRRPHLAAASDAGSARPGTPNPRRSPGPDLDGNELSDGSSGGSDSPRFRPESPEASPRFKEEQLNDSPRFRPEAEAEAGPSGVSARGVKRPRSAAQAPSAARRSNRSGSDEFVCRRCGQEQATSETLRLHDCSSKFAWTDETKGINRARPTSYNELGEDEPQLPSAKRNKKPSGSRSSSTQSGKTCSSGGSAESANNSTASYSFSGFSDEVERITEGARGVITLSKVAATGSDSSSSSDTDSQDGGGKAGDIDIDDGVEPFQLEDEGPVSDVDSKKTDEAAMLTAADLFDVPVDARSLKSVDNNDTPSPPSPQGSAVDEPPPNSPTEDKPYKCPVCDKGFKKAISLKKHNRTCAKCQKSCLSLYHRPCDSCKLCIWSKDEVHQTCTAVKCKAPCFTSNEAYLQHIRSHSYKDIL